MFGFLTMFDLVMLRFRHQSSLASQRSTPYTGQSRDGYAARPALKHAADVCTSNGKEIKNLTFPKEDRCSAGTRRPGLAGGATRAHRPAASAIFVHAAAPLQVCRHCCMVIEERCASRVAADVQRRRPGWLCGAAALPDERCAECPKISDVRSRTPSSRLSVHFSHRHELRGQSAVRMRR